MTVLKPTNYVVFDSWLIDVLACDMVEINSAKKLRDMGPYKEAPELGNTPLTWNIDVVNPLIGDALTCHFPETLAAGSEVSVRVYYKTDPAAQAFSWM